MRDHTKLRNCGDQEGFVRHIFDQCAKTKFPLAYILNNLNSYG